MKISYKY